MISINFRLPLKRTATGRYPATDEYSEDIWCRYCHKIVNTWKRSQQKCLSYNWVQIPGPGYDSVVHLRAEDGSCCTTKPMHSPHRRSMLVLTCSPQTKSHWISEATTIRMGRQKPARGNSSSPWSSARHSWVDLSKNILVIINASLMCYNILCLLRYDVTVRLNNLFNHYTETRLRGLAQLSHFHTVRKSKQDKTKRRPRLISSGLVWKCGTSFTLITTDLWDGSFVTRYPHGIWLMSSPT